MFAKGVICTPHTLKALSFDVAVASVDRFARHHRCFTFKAMGMAMGEAPGAITAREKKDNSSSVNKPSPTPLISVDTPRGTRDFPPEDMRLRSWLFNNFREVSKLFAFEEIDFPMLESEELYTRKAGEEIVDQLYNFEDKGGRRVALRPELTPSLARLVLQKSSMLGNLCI